VVLVCVVRVFFPFFVSREPAEFSQRLEGRRHRGWRQVLSLQAAGPEKDHILLAVNHFERKVGTDLDHNHVDGVGPYVDGRNTHAGLWSSTGPALACYKA